MTPSVADRPSWADVVTTTARLLTFRASETELVNLSYRHLILGLGCTWIVGIGRYWDNPRVGLLQHLGTGSVVYIFALSLFLWLIVWPLKPQHWSYLRVVTFVSLVSPPAILYAIPLEMMMRMQAANDANVVLLGIVAVWRVALLFYFLRVLARLDLFSIVVVGLLPLTLIVVALTVLNLEKAVFELMGGLRDRTPNDDAYFVMGLLSLLSLVLFIPLVVGYLILVVQKRLKRAHA
jgi:hypothetical protein